MPNRQNAATVVPEDIAIVNGLINVAIVWPIIGMIPTKFLNKGTTNTNRIPMTMEIKKFNPKNNPKKMPGFLKSDLIMQNKANNIHAATKNR